MAILNDLIVRGATRCLNTLYANSLQVDSQTISGDLTVNGYTYMGYSTSRTDTKLSVAGITNNQWYRSTGNLGWYNDSYGGGIYMTDSTYVKTYNNKAFYAYNGLYTGSTQQYYLNVNGKLNAADGVFSNNLNVGNSLVGRNISATNLLRAAKYDLQTITQVGSNGTLYVAPSIQFPTSNTTSVATASTSITIIDTNITSDVMAGVVWRPSAKVKISGTINGVVTGTVDGTITSINTSSKTMVIGNLSGGNWSSVVAGTYTKDKIENLNIMMYETYQNSTYYPVGILLTSYGSVGEHTDGTAKTFINIYGGSATKPVVRLGSMTGLDAINGVTPSGWGLYTSNGYFSGLIVSTSGKIGGWSLSTNSLTTGTWGSSSSAMLCTGSTTQKSIGGSPASTSGWVFTAGANFGVTSSGALYANSAHISGEITATSGTIGGASITDGTLTVPAAQVNGELTAATINGSKITANTITASQIATNAITADELAANAVTSAKIKAGEVKADNIAANAVTAAKISVDNLSAISASMGTLTSGTISYGTVGSNSSFYLSSSDASATIAGASRTGLRLTVGSTFGFSLEALYASNAIISGNITATSGSISGSIVTTGISADNITTGTLSAERIDASSLSIGISQVTNLQTTLNGKQPSGDYATNTALTNSTGWSVIINISAINYTANTATLHATVYKDGAVKTNDFTLQWYKTVTGTTTTTTAISGATSSTLNVTSTMGLDAAYTCIVS